MSLLQSVASVVGFATLAVLSFRFLRFVFNAVASRHNTLRKYDAKNKDVWAVVTGSSGGIGKEYAIQLASRGFNIVLISRSAERLQPVAEEIKAKNVQAKIIAFDFGTSDPTEYTKNLGPQLASLDISILVNNVGCNIDYPEFFADHSQGDFESMINTNIRSVHQMTHLLIDKLSSRKSSAIINVASQSATMPSAPMLGVYAGTKAYVVAFSRAIAVEYKAKRVDVQCVTPSMVVSNMSKRRPAWDCPRPSAVVKPSLNSLGNGTVVLSPYPMHAVMDFVMDLLPASFVGQKVLALHKSTQRAAIKKRGERKK